MSEKKGLESIVPPPEMCKLIPAGALEDSALIWFFDGTDWRVIAREFDAWSEEEYPAPTLAEIMEELYEQHDFVGAKLKDGVCQVGCFRQDDDEAKVCVSAKSLATAALRLWLEVNGIASDETPDARHKEVGK